MLWQQKVMDVQDAVISETVEMPTSALPSEVSQPTHLVNAVSSGSGWAG
jgi:hypothetical protein